MDYPNFCERNQDPMEIEFNQITNLVADSLKLIRMNIQILRNRLKYVNSEIEMLHFQRLIDDLNICKRHTDEVSRDTMVARGEYYDARKREENVLYNNL